MYTHKPTTPGDSRAKFERTVYCDGKNIGKIHQINFGPPKGKWWWALEWMTDKNAGLADSMEEALGIVKARHQNAK